GDEAHNHRCAPNHGSDPGVQRRASIRSLAELDRLTQPTVRDGTMRRSTIARVAPLVIFIGALIANRRAATALLVWSDTFNDQSDVNRCLAENLCTLVGRQTSIPGLFNA